MTLYELLDIASPYTGLIGTLGTITAIVKACSDMVHQKPKVTIAEYSSQLNGFYRSVDPKYNTDKILVLHFEITNLRHTISAPIQKVIIHYYGLSFRPQEYTLIKDFAFDGAKYKLHPIDKVIPYESPFKLDPSSTRRVQMVFPFVADIYKDYIENNSKPVTLELEFVLTPKSSIKKKVIVGELTIESTEANRDPIIMGKLDT